MRTGESGPESLSEFAQVYLHDHQHVSAGTVVRGNVTNLELNLKSGLIVEGLAVISYLVRLVEGEDL